MKLSSLLLLFVLTSITSFSQITLNNSDFSDVGDTVRISTAAPDPTIDYSTTGANQTWDFSFLTAQSQELLEYNDPANASFLVQVQFGSFAASDYQATNYIENNDIPLDQLGTFLPVNITAVYGYSKNTADSITSLGYSMDIDGIEVPIQSDTIETRYKFPLNYNDSYSSRGYTLLDMNPIYNGIWIQHRERNSVVDGWGSITTPYGTFDALRVKHTIFESDSIYMDLFGSPQWIGLPIPESNIYEWITIGEKEPILRISTSTVLGNETITSVTYRDNYLGLDASLDELGLSMVYYPNPVSDELHIELEEKGANYQLIDLKGRVVAEGILGLTNTISVKELTVGSYLLQVNLGNKRSIVHVVKD